MHQDASSSTCGHAAYAHVNGPGVVGDCLHRTDGRFLCACEGFVESEEHAA